MTRDFHQLRQVSTAEVYKSGKLAGTLQRQSDSSTVFTYHPDYVQDHGEPVASTLPVNTTPVVTAGGGLPPFFAGLLPEGHRLTVVRDAVKTSLNDELSLLLAVGADTPGDVQVVPAGITLEEPPALLESPSAEDLDFSTVVQALDLQSLPGVQDKASASMLSAPLTTRGGRFILKLDPPRHPHLVLNEHAHLQAAKALRLPVSEASVIHDRHGLSGLLVRRFDRVRTPEGWSKLALEDATQVMGLPPAAKYNVTSEDAVAALSQTTNAPAIATRNLYLQFVFAWLTGNGDLHAKNISVLTQPDGKRTVAPIYDVPCTLLYGDDSQALPVAGRTKNIRERHWAEFAATVGLPQRAAQSANERALGAAAAVSLSSLPFEGSPLRHAERELRARRSVLS